MTHELKALNELLKEFETMPQTPGVIEEIEDIKFDIKVIETNLRSIDLKFQSISPIITL